MFSNEQTELLNKKLDPDRVRQRRGADGKPVLYLEAWDLVERANAIFGFGNWSRETVSITPIHEPVMRQEDNPSKTVMVASFWAKVRITVTDGTRSVVREGCGAATAYQKTVGEAVEQAIKAAESDATKRAFATFGNQFGLALYDKSHRNVGHDDPPGPDHNQRAAIDVGFNAISPGASAESGAFQREPAPEPAMPNSQRALARLPDRPTGNGRYANGHAPRSNGGMRY